MVGRLLEFAIAIADEASGSPAGGADTGENVDGPPPSLPPLPHPPLLDVVRVLMLNTETLVFDLDTGEGSMNTGGCSEELPLPSSPCLEEGVLDPDAAAADETVGSTAVVVVTGVILSGGLLVSS